MYLVQHKNGRVYRQCEEMIDITDEIRERSENAPPGSPIWFGREFATALCKQRDERLLELFKKQER